MIISNGILIMFVVVMLFLFSHFGDAFMQLQKLNKTAKIWEERTREIYSLGINPKVVDGTQEEAMYIVDKLAKLYDRLQYNHHTFFIDADNFLREKGKMNFGYEENIHKKEDMYSMDGACLVVNENYFTVNPIEPKVNIQHSFIYDKNTMNVLIPEKLKSKETMVKQAMLASFYAYKIEITNERRKEESKPLLDIKKEDLKINIIYVNNNQHYFTYNPNDGLPEKNYFITDPVVAIINSSMDSDYLGSEMTFAQLVKGKSKKQAMEHIAKDVYKTKTEDCIHNLVSVYGKLGQDVQYVKFYVQLYGLSMAGVLLLLVLLILFRVSSYYRIYYQKITVYILHGQSRVRILRSSIITQTIVVIAASSVIAAVMKFPWVMGAGIVLSVFMALMMVMYGRYLSEKSISGLKRGG